VIVAGLVLAISLLREGDLLVAGSRRKELALGFMQAGIVQTGLLPVLSPNVIEESS